MVLSILIVHVATVAVLLWGAWSGLHRVRIYTALFAGLLGYQLLAIPDLTLFVERYGPSIVMTAELAALVGAIVLVGMIQGLERAFNRRDNSLAAAVDGVMASPGVYGAAVFGAILVIAVVTSRRGVALLEMTWEEAREDLGVADSAATLLLFFAFPACWVAWRAKQRGIALMMGVLALILTAIYGSRAALLTIPAAVAIDLHTRGVLTRSRSALWRGALAVLAVVIVFHVSGRVIRALGLGGLVALMNDGFASNDTLIQLLGEIDWTGGESDVFDYYFFVHSAGTVPGVEPLATLVRWFLMYIPRSLAESLKPMDPAYQLWTHGANSGLFDAQPFLSQVLTLVRAGDQGSIHPTLWGEAWINGRWLALIVMCAVLGTIVWAIDRLLVKMPSDVIVMVAPATVVGYLFVARGNSTIGLGYFAYLFPLALVCHAFLAWLLPTVRPSRPKVPS